MLPFGCGVYYYPAPTKTSHTKCGARLHYGVFLGYVAEAGCRWNNKYRVAAVEGFVGESLHVDVPHTQFPNFIEHITALVKLPISKGLEF